MSATGWPRLGRPEPQSWFAFNDTCAARNTAALIGVGTAINELQKQVFMATAGSAVACPGP
jgi:hypothetical protein